MQTACSLPLEQTAGGGRGGVLLSFLRVVLLEVLSRTGSTQNDSCPSAPKGRVPGKQGYPNQRCLGLLQSMSYDCLSTCKLHVTSRLLIPPDTNAYNAVLLME